MKASTKTMIQGALGRMHNRVDDWIMEGITDVTPTHLTFQIRFLFTEIDMEIDRQEQRSSFKPQRLADIRTPRFEEIILDVFTGHITPKMIWENKEVWFEEAARSRAEWGQLTDAEQVQVRTKLLATLREMNSFIEEWLPVIEPNSGNYLDIFMRVAR